MPGNETWEAANSKVFFGGLCVEFFALNRGLRALEEAFHRLAGLGQILLAEPEVGVAFARAHDGIGKGQLVARHQPADVVGVHVGDVNLIDLRWRVACGLDAVLQVAKGGAKQPGGTGVDQDQLVAGVDQAGVTSTTSRSH